MFNKIEANKDNPQEIIRIAFDALDEYPSLSDILKFEIGRNYYRLNEYKKAKKYLLEADVEDLTNLFLPWKNIILGKIYEKENYKLSRNLRLTAAKGPKELELDVRNNGEEESVAIAALDDLVEADIRYFASLDSHHYSDHKLIYPVEDLTQLSTLNQNQIMVVSLQTLRDANLDFPMGHPVAKQLYVCHPFCQNKFIPYDYSTPRFSTGG